MSIAAPYPDALIADGWTDLGTAWVSSLGLNALRVQRLQLETMFALQSAAVAFNRELWDTWQCRFAGGVPIDG